MDLDMAMDKLQDAADDYRADPTESGFETLMMWQNIVNDLIDEMEHVG